jgi:hypothetical protein
MSATPEQRAIRPIVFDDQHQPGANISAKAPENGYVGSKHHAVYDGMAGPFSMTIVLNNTPEVRELLLNALARAEAENSDFIIVAARNRRDPEHRTVPHRLTVHLA